MKGILIIIIAFCTLQGMSQAYVLDKVIAKVGNEYVLHSEVQENLSLMSERGPVEEGTNCIILENLMVTSLLVHQAHIDSNEVSKEDIDKRLDANMADILRQMGNDVQRFQEYYQMSITEAKELTRYGMRKQLNAQRMQSSIVEGIKVTPNEVIEYFNQIPTDSLPYFNSEVELGEIVYRVPVNDDERQKAMDEAIELRNRIENGEDFGEMARLHSDDRGSAVQNGNLGLNARGTFVPEFEAAAYNLDNDELSRPIETQFGFHIIKLNSPRLGNAIDVSHILIRPTITDDDKMKAQEHLLDVRKEMVEDSLDFVEAVRKYSDKDVQSYTNSGRMVNSKTGNTFFETQDVDSDIFFAIDTIDIDDLTVPIEFRTSTGDPIYRIVKLQSRTRPHRASLETDYAKILEAARQSKRNESFNEWVDDQVRGTYIHIDAHYSGCPNLERWRGLTSRS